MTSSEMVDSGRLSGGRSNFSQTCSLLSRYLKEKGSFGDIRLSFNQNLESRGAPTQTMNLLPMIENSNTNALAHQVEAQKKSDLCDAKSAAETAPMTIFYGGKVIVFNDLLPNKASEIISMAHKSSAAFPPPPAVHTPAESAAIRSAQPPADSDLPIARKNSLTRFLEKRKDRITANAPYPANKPAAAAKTVVKAEPWLELSSPIPGAPLH